MFRLLMQFSLTLLIVSLCEGYNYPDLCRQNVTIKKINKDQYAGEWYDLCHSKHLGYRCAVSNATSEIENGQIIHTRRAIVMDKDGIKSMETQYLRMLREKNDNYPDIDLYGRDVRPRFVMDTDYDNYALEFICDEDGTESVLFLVRSNTLSDEHKQILEDLQDKHGIEDLECQNECDTSVPQTQE